MNEELEDHRINTPNKLIEVQSRLDNVNNGFIDQLNDRDRDKFDAVKRALDLLGEAGVPVTMFTILPANPRYTEQESNADSVEDLRRYMTMQYNNMSYFIDIEQDSHFSIKDKIFMSYWNLTLILAMVNYVRTTIADPKAAALTPLSMGSLANIAQAFYFYGILPEEWKTYVNKDGTYKSDDIAPVPDCPSRVRTDISQAEIQQAILTACEGSKKLFDNLPTNIQTQITENE